MIRFLLVFLSVYSLMHALFYLRVRVLFPDRWPYHLIFSAFLAVMVFGPIGARLLERADHHVLARISAYAGYSWMGFIFYAFWLFLLLGMIEVIFKIINFTAGKALPALTGPLAVVCVLLLTLAINVYGHFEAANLRVERFSIRTAKLPPGVDRVRIAQISDIHLGLMVGDGKLEAILEKVKAESPDILVSTGDVVDGDMNRINNLPTIFGTVQPRLGKYAVTGNHEIYAGLVESIQAERSFGFKILRGAAANAGNILNIVGVDDPAAGMPVDEKALLAGAQNGLFTLLLKHRPEVDSGSLGLFDLQLSGHTHYGQIYPFRYIAQRVYPLQNGPYFLEKGSVLYTSRGSATWGPPIRVLAPPEVTIIDIVRE